jgi:predicted ester cyclase
VRFLTQSLHQAGYRQRKDDLHTLNESYAQLQQQLKRAENFVSGLQGAVIISLQSTPYCPICFDAIAGTALCLENMCLSLVQLLQLPDCPTNIVQDASRYRFLCHRLFERFCHSLFCSLLEAYMLHCAGEGDDRKENSSKMEQPLRLFQHRVDNLKTFATAVCSKLHPIFSQSDFAELTASAAMHSVQVQENYELRNQLDSLNSDYMQLLHQSKTLEDSEAGLKLELERVKRRALMQGEPSLSSSTTPSGSSSTPHASTQENTAWKDVAEKRKQELIVQMKRIQELQRALDDSTGQGNLELLAPSTNAYMAAIKQRDIASGYREQAKKELEDERRKVAHFNVQLNDEVQKLKDVHDQIRVRMFEEISDLRKTAEQRAVDIERLQAKLTELEGCKGSSRTSEEVTRLLAFSEKEYSRLKSLTTQALEKAAASDSKMKQMKEREIHLTEQRDSLSTKVAELKLRLGESTGDDLKPPADCPKTIEECRIRVASDAKFIVRLKRQLDDYHHQNKSAKADADRYLDEMDSIGQQLNAMQEQNAALIHDLSNVEANGTRAVKEALALRSRCSALEKNLTDQKANSLMKEKAFEEQLEKSSLLKQEISLQFEQVKECEKEKLLAVDVCSQRLSALEKAEAEVDVLKRVELDLTRKLAAAQQVQSDLRDELIDKEFKKKRVREEEVPFALHTPCFAFLAFHIFVRKLRRHLVQGRILFCDCSITKCGKRFYAECAKSATRILV